jgi:DNA-binding transcriptional regulator YdaS (Cro superfamily)
MAKRKLGIHSLIFDDDEVIQLLRAAIERAGTQDAFARRYGIDRTHLNQILSGEKSVNRAVESALGLRRVYAPNLRRRLVRRQKHKMTRVI